MNIEKISQIAKNTLKTGALITALNLTGCMSKLPDQPVINPEPVTTNQVTKPKIEAITSEQMVQIPTPEGRLVAQRINSAVAQKEVNGRNGAVVENDLESQKPRTLLNINPLTDKIILFTSSRGDQRIIILRADDSGKLQLHLGENNKILIANNVEMLSKLGDTDSSSQIVNNPQILESVHVILNQSKGVIPISVDEIYIPQTQTPQTKAIIRPEFVTKLSQFGVSVLDNSGKTLTANYGEKQANKNLMPEEALKYDLKNLNPEKDIFLTLEYLNNKKILVQNYRDVLFVSETGKPQIKMFRQGPQDLSNIEQTRGEILEEVVQKEIPRKSIKSEVELLEFYKTL